MRRLGRRWGELHRVVSAAAIPGGVHFWWQVKADIREPLAYAGILAVLLGWRVYRSRAAKATAARIRTPPAPVRQSSASPRIHQARADASTGSPTDTTATKSGERWRSDQL